MLKPLNVTIQIIASRVDSQAMVRRALRLFANALAAIHTWAAVTSQSMNADGISYLDIGDAYFKRDWGHAINPVWSPVYSWVLGLGNFIFRPPVEWQFTLVHLINFAIFSFTLLCFEYFWVNLQKQTPPEDEPGTIRLPGWLWWVLGYLLFIWTTLSLIQMWAATPDMLMAGLVLLSATYILRIRGGETGARQFLLLGLVLGIGYLTKSIMFSFALVFLVLSFLVQNWSRKAAARTFLAAVVFMLISLPFILLISQVKGKLTIGEAGSVTYLRYVNGMPFPHWQGDPENGIVPLHGSRLIHAAPPVYEFGEPVGGTYPISTDPSYWYEGIQPRLDFTILLTRLAWNSLEYVELFVQKQGFLTTAVIALYLAGQWRRYNLIQLLRRWALVIPALAAFGVYGLILVEDRYIGVFVLLFWADFLANIRLPGTGNSRVWINILGSIAATGLLVNIGLFNLEGFNRLDMTSAAGESEVSAPAARPVQVALALREQGVLPGDRVGVIGYAYDSFWARLAGVKIVAELLEADTGDLWRGGPDLHASVLTAFESAGARAVVAEYVPGDASMTGWQQVGATNYFIYVFHP